MSFHVDESLNARLRMFQNFKKVSEQTLLPHFGNGFYQRTKTNAEQTVWFHPREIICLDQFLTRLITVLLFNCFMSFFYFMNT